MPAPGQTHLVPVPVPGPRSRWGPRLGEHGASHYKRYVDIITRTAHSAALIVRGVGYDVDGHYAAPRCALSSASLGIA